MTRCLFSAFALAILCAAAGADEGSWVAPPARGQLEQDPTFIPRGKGYLFVPTMTSPLNEPSYQVFQNGEEIASANPGTGVLLNPGVYEVLIGSGSISQMMSRQIPITEGQITLVKPFWSGLVINVIDENRTSLNESYELFYESKQENFGIGFGIEEERGEAVKTWLLPSGVYTVLKVGDNASTPRKFSVKIEPGELIQRNLVFDAGTRNFIGFYPPLGGFTGQTRLDVPTWKTQWQLSGSTLFNTSQNTVGEDRSSIALSAQINSRTTYSSKRHFASLRLILEEGFTREQGAVFRKTVDEVEFRGTYIYRLSRSIGPYLRGVVNTKFFSTEARFDSPQRLYLLGAMGDTLQVLADLDEFTLSPSFSPLQLRQGVGINSQLYRSFPLNLNVRIGMGARQTYVSESFDLSQDRSFARQLRNATSTGLEALIILDSRLTRFVSWDSEFDILMPSPKSKEWEFTWENRWRILLSRFINLDIVVDFEREKPLRRLQSRQQILLRFVYLL